MIVDEYTLVKLIDKDQFGEVYLGSKKESYEKFAIKKRDPSKFFKFKGRKKYLNNELFLMKDMNYPNIIKLFDIKKPGLVYIITEYCNGGNLKQFLENYLKINNKALPEEIVQSIMRQVIEAFRYLYNKKIIHRYINLRHILINYENDEDRKNNNIMKGKIKIINFLCASYLQKGKLRKSFVGDFLTMSPIILNKHNNIDYKDIGYGEKEDIWSLGIICYELLVGKNPFGSNINGELLNKINNGEYYVPITLSKEAISFINCMLQYYPQNRLSVDELYNHDFLRKNVKEFNKLDLNIIKKYGHNSQIKISTKNNELIKEILAKPICNSKNKEN